MDIPGQRQASGKPNRPHMYKSELEQITHGCTEQERGRYWVRPSYDYGNPRIKVQKVKRKTANRKKYNLRKLDDSECQRTFEVKLREGASSLRYKEPEGVEEKGKE